MAEPNSNEALEIGATCPADEHSGVRVRLLTPGETIADKYVIHGQLGQGGFAVVYDAEHLGLGRRVAIKVVHLHEATDASMLERSKREARISALVRHPNVLEVFDTGVLEDGSPYLVMERIDGDTLSEHIARGPLTIPAVVELGRQLAAALEALEARSIIHRDIKPENLMLHEAGNGQFVVKLVDFGISRRAEPAEEGRLTWTGSLLGTPYYMSPEQVRGDELDARADVYSAGVVLYEALTGHVPHDRPTLGEVLLATLNDDIRPPRELRPRCPHELDRIVMKAMSRSTADRYPSAAALKAELDEFVSSCGLPRDSDAWCAVEPIEPEQVSPMRTLALDSLSGVRKLRYALPASGRLQAAMAGAGLMLVAGVALLNLSAEASETSTLRAVAEQQPVSAEATSEPVDTRAQLPEAAEATRVPTLSPVEREAAVELTSVAPVPVAETSDAATQEKQRPRAKKVSVPVVVEPVRSEAANFAMRVASSGSQQVMNEALSAYAHGRFAVAQQLYRKAAQLAPNDASAWRGLGLVAARRGDHAEARTALARYLVLRPHAADAKAIRQRIAGLPSQR